MAIVTQFLTGFEHGFIGAGGTDMSGITAGGGLWDTGPTSGTAPSMSSTTPRNGSYCAHFVRPANTRVNLIKNTTGSPTKIVLRCGIKVSARPSSGTPIIIFGGASGVTFNLTVDSTGALAMQAGTGTPQAGPVIDTTSWHLIEAQVDVHANPWTVDWKVDGVAKTQATNATTATTIASIALGTYNSTTQAGYTCDFDDFIFGTYTGASPSSTEWYGDGQCLAQFPGSDGTHVTVADFSGGDATAVFSGTVTTAYTFVDSPPATSGWTNTRSTTDNLGMRVVNTGAYMEIAPATTSQTGSANAVRGILSYSSSSTTANAAACGVRNSAGTITDLWGTLGGTLADYSEITNFYKGAIVAVPVAGWTATEVNALRWRFGGGTSSDISPVPTVQEFMLEVDWPVSGIINITITAVAASSTSTAPVPTSITATQNPTVTATPGLSVATAPVPTLVNARAPPSAGATSTAPVVTVLATQNPTITAVSAGATSAAPVSTVMVTVTAVSAGSTSTSSTPTVSVTLAAVSASSTSAAPAPSLASSPTITAVAASSTSAAPTPSVTANQNVTITAVTASATASAPVATVASTQNPTITAVGASASSAAPAPTVVATQNVTITAVPANALASAATSTVTATQNPTITAVSAGSISTSPAPSVSVGVNVSITAVSAGATSAAPTSTVVATQNPTITAVSAGSTSTAPAPTVVPSQNVTIAGGPLTYALVGTAGVENTTGVTGGDLNNLAWGTGENRTLNNLLVLAVQCYGTATLPSAPSGWFVAVQQAGTSCSASVFYKVAAGSDAAPTVTGVTGGVLNGNLTEFSGNATTSPVDQTQTSASASSPVVVTMPGTDATSGELTVWTNTSAYSPATAINPISVTCNDGSTHGLAQNPSSTATNHYATFYTITTSNSAADAWTYTPNTITNLTGEATVVVSFTRGVSGVSSGTTSSAPVPALRIDETEVAVSAGSTSTAPTPTVLATQNVTITAVAASGVSAASAPVPQITLASPSAGSTATAPVPTVLATQNPTVTAVAAGASSAAPVPTLRLDVTDTPPAAGALAAAPVPTVTSTQNRTITAVAASTTATAPVPTLEIDEADTVPSAGAIATAPVPTVLATQNPTVTAVSASSTSSAPIPTVTSIQNVTITAVGASALATATIPSISSGQGVTLSVPSAGISATVPVPSVTATQNPTILAVTASAIATSSPPTIRTDGTVVAPSASVVATAPIPAISAGQSITVTAVTASATASAPAPTITSTQNRTVVATTASATASAPAPTITTTISRTITAVSASASAGAPVPTIRIDETVTAPSASATSTAPIPVVAVRNYQTFTVSLAGQLTSSGITTKQPQKPLAAVVSTSGALVRSTNAVIRGAVTATATSIKDTSKGLTTSFSLRGAATKRFVTTIVSGLNLGGVTAELRGRLFEAGLSFIGSLFKALTRAIHGIAKVTDEPTYTAYLWDEQTYITKLSDE